MADDKQSGGVSAQAGNDVNVGGDVFGRDKIQTTQQTQTTVVHAPESSRPTSYAIVGLVIVAVIAVIAILVLAALTRPASPTLTALSTSTLTPTLTESAERAALLNSATLSTTGHDLVTVTAISPVMASTSTATSALTLIPTLVPTPVPSITSMASSTRPVTPFTKLPTAIKPANRPGTGTLDVQVVLEGCNNLTYDIVSSRNQGTGSGQANTNKQVAAGTYTITLKSQAGEQLTNQAVVRQDQTTKVDFTAKLGKLRMKGYPQVGAPWFAVSPGGILPLAADYDHCIPAGKYTITFIQFSPCYGYGFACSSTTLALFPDKVSAVFDVEVKAGETTVIQPERWPIQVGRLAFLPAMTIGSARIEDLQNSIQFTRSLNDNSGQYWMLVGKYKITLINQPYTDTTYEFEIKAGEQTVLESPQ
jgi:hypothetical protein